MREYWSNRQDRTLEDHSKELEQLVADLPEEPLVYADSENAPAINQFAAWGWQVQAAIKNVLDSIDCIRSLLKVQPATGEPRLTISAACRRLVAEMRKYRWHKPRSGTASPVPRPLKREDDCVDALRYAVYSYEQQQGRAPGSLTYKAEPVRYGVRLERHTRRW